MTIEQKGIVDIISVVGDVATLVISDHLDWETDVRGHMFALQEKVNDYLSFIEGGTLLEARPDLRGKKLVLKVVQLFQPSGEGAQFQSRLQVALAEAGYELEFERRDAHGGRPQASVK